MPLTNLTPRTTTTPRDTVSGAVVRPLSHQSTSVRRKLEVRSQLSSFGVRRRRHAVLERAARVMLEPPPTRCLPTKRHAHVSDLSRSAPLHPSTHLAHVYPVRVGPVVLEALHDVPAHQARKTEETDELAHARDVHVVTRLRGVQPVHNHRHIAEHARVYQS